MIRREPDGECSLTKSGGIGFKKPNTFVEVTTKTFFETEYTVRDNFDHKGELNNELVFVFPANIKNY